MFYYLFAFCYLLVTLYTPCQRRHIHKAITESVQLVLKECESAPFPFVTMSMTVRQHSGNGLCRPQSM